MNFDLVGNKSVLFNFLEGSTFVGWRYLHPLNESFLYGSWVYETTGGDFLLMRDHRVSYRQVAGTDGSEERNFTPCFRVGTSTRIWALTLRTFEGEELWHYWACARIII